MRMDLLADRYPLLWRYGFLVRFVVLFLIWGTVAFDYKIFMDLSVRGLVLSALFFLGSILVFVGYKTRTSMLLLAIPLVAHGVLFRSESSLVGAALAILSTSLPIGAFYSVDRFLAVGAAPVPYQPGQEALHQRLHLPWRLLFASFLAFNVGGPAYNQVFHNNTRMVLNWDMFAEIGRDLVVVHFFREAGESREYLDYMKVLGHPVKTPGVRRNLRVLKDIRIVGLAQLNDVVRRVCASADDPTTIRLEAKITTLKQGWRRLYDGTAPICDANRMPRLKSFPGIELRPLTDGDDAFEGR